MRPVQISLADRSHDRLIPDHLFVFDMDHRYSPAAALQQALRVQPGMARPVQVQLQSEVRPTGFNERVEESLSGTGTLKLPVMVVVTKPNPRGF